MHKDTDCGIVYIATGKEFVEEARISAESAKSVMPDVPITLFTDNKVEIPVFDNVVEIENPRHDFGDQVCHLSRTPYERTIFLDTDIYLDASIEDLFSILDKFDLAAAHNQTNYSSERIKFDAVKAIPDCFPEYNSGVIAFKSNQAITDFFQKWEYYYNKVLDRGQIHNQAAFRLALYHSDIRITTLPLNYNCVFRRPGCVNGQIKVFHGRIYNINTPGAGEAVDIKQATAELNRRTDLRAYHRIGDEIKLIKQGFIDQVYWSIKGQGIIKTIKRIPHYIQNRI